MSAFDAVMTSALSPQTLISLFYGYMTENPAPWMVMDFPPTKDVVITELIIGGAWKLIVIISGDEKANPIGLWANILNLPEGKYPPKGVIYVFVSLIFVITIGYFEEVGLS